MTLLILKKPCLPNNKGGTELCDLSSFNMALLAKQCWRLMTNQESFAT